jgi:hypothetical protein
MAKKINIAPNAKTKANRAARRSPSRFETQENAPKIIAHKNPKPAKITLVSQSIPTSFAPQNTDV